MSLRANEMYTWSKAELKHFLHYHAVPTDGTMEQSELLQLAQAVATSLSNGDSCEVSPKTRAAERISIHSLTEYDETPLMHRDISGIADAPNPSHVLHLSQRSITSSPDEAQSLLLAEAFAHEELANSDATGSFSNFSPDPPPQRAMGGPPSTSSSSRPRWNRQWSKELEDRIHRAGVASTASMGAEDLDGAEDPADDLAGD
eukprot:EG_transcript_31550